MAVAVAVSAGAYVYDLYARIEQFFHPDLRTFEERLRRRPFVWLYVSTIRYSIFVSQFLRTNAEWNNLYVRAVRPSLTTLRIALDRKKMRSFFCQFHLQGCS